MTIPAIQNFTQSVYDSISSKIGSFFADYNNASQLNNKPVLADYVVNGKPNYIAFHHDLKKYLHSEDIKYGSAADAAPLGAQIYGYFNYITNSVKENMYLIGKFLHLSKGSEYLDSIRAAYNQATLDAKAQHEAWGSYKVAKSQSKHLKQKYHAEISDHLEKILNCHTDSSDFKEAKKTCIITHQVPVFKCPAVVTELSKERNDIKALYQDSTPILGKLTISYRNSDKYSSESKFHDRYDYDCTKIAAAAFRTGGADMGLQSNTGAEIYYPFLTIPTEGKCMIVADLSDTFAKSPLVEALESTAGA